MPRLIFSLAVLSLTFVLTACAAPEPETAEASEPAAEPAPEPAAAETEEPERPEAPMIEIVNARQPLPGILSGGQPTDQQLREAAEKGFRTVVNLRSEP